MNCGASLATKYLAGDNNETETNAIWDAFGSLELDLEWVYDIIPEEILNPQPVPDWYINQN